MISATRRTDLPDSKSGCGERTIARTNPARGRLALKMPRSPRGGDSDEVPAV
jgi:hypothetical protein